MFKKIQVQLKARCNLHQFAGLTRFRVRKVPSASKILQIYHSIHSLVSKQKGKHANHVQCFTMLSFLRRWGVLSMKHCCCHFQICSYWNSKVIEQKLKEEHILAVLPLKRCLQQHSNMDNLDPPAAWNQDEPSILLSWQVTARSLVSPDSAQLTEASGFAVCHLSGDACNGPCLEWSWPRPLNHSPWIRSPPSLLFWDRRAISHGLPPCPGAWTRNATIGARVCRFQTVVLRKDQAVAWRTGANFLPVVLSALDVLSAHRWPTTSSQASWVKNSMPVTCQQVPTSHPMTEAKLSMASWSWWKAKQPKNNHNLSWGIEHNSEKWCEHVSTSLLPLSLWLRLSSFIHVARHQVSNPFNFHVTPLGWNSKEAWL